MKDGSKNETSTCNKLKVKNESEYFRLRLENKLQQSAIKRSAKSFTL